MSDLTLFISYSHADEPIVNRLHEDLRQAGAVIWLDHEQLIPGTPNWQRAIRDGIDAAQQVIYVGSPEAADSPYVLAEISLARSKGRHIIPFWVRGDNWHDCAPLELALTQYADGRDGRYAQGLRDLLASLGSVDGGARAVAASLPTMPTQSDSTLASRRRSSASHRFLGDRMQRAMGVTTTSLVVLVVLAAFLVSYRSFFLPATPTTTLTASPTATPLAVCGASVDMGNPQSEQSHDLIGWGMGGYDPQNPSPSGDTTFRYQPQRYAAHVTLCISKVGVAYTLTTEVQDFGCDDSFEIFVDTNPTPIYSFTGTRANIIRVHTVQIPAADITSHNVVLGFESTSKDCGIAAVYNIRLTPTVG